MSEKPGKERKSEAVEDENSDSAEEASGESSSPSQNGRPSENQDGGLGVAKPVSENLLQGNACINNSGVNSENKLETLLNMIRNKLISEFSSGIFGASIETILSKMHRMKINSERLSVIEEILIQIYLLSDPEKLVLYLKLPHSMNSTTDPLTRALNLLGNSQKFRRAIYWVKTHLDVESERAAAIEDAYNEYLKYCRDVSVKPLSAADFENILKQVFRENRPRRLGTRGNSRNSNSGMGNTIRLPTPFLPRSDTESNVPTTSGRNDYCLLSTEIEEGGSEDGNEKWRKPTTSFKTPSAAAGKDSAPKGSIIDKSSTNNEDRKVAQQNFTNDLNPGSENRNDLNQPFNDPSGHNSGLGHGSGTSSDNINDFMGNDSTHDKVSPDSPDKSEVQKEESNAEGSPETDAEKSNEVNAVQSSTESDESEPNNFIVTKLPLRIIKRIISSTALKRLNNPRNLRSQGGKNSMVMPRSMGQGRRTRSLPQPPRPRSRRNYLPIQPKLASGGTYWLHIHLGVKNKKNEVPDLTEVEEEIVKYFRHLEDTELLGIVGGDIMDELLKLENISGNIYNVHMNTPGATGQSYLENNLGITYSPTGNTAQGGLPQRSPSSADNSAEPTTTFLEQGNVGYIPKPNLFSNTENPLIVNTDELTTQNNGVADRICEMVPVSPTTNYFHFIPISPIPRTPMITPGAGPFLTPPNAQTMPNNNIVPANNGFLPPDNNFLPSNTNFVPTNNDFMPPNNGFLPPNNVLLPPGNALPADNSFYSPGGNFIPPNNILPPNNDLFSGNGAFTAPIRNGFTSPSSNALPPSNSFVPLNNGFPPANSGFLSPDSTELNDFNIVNLDDGFNEQNNMIPGGAFPNITPDMMPRSASANFYGAAARDESPELLNYDQFMPNEMNFDPVDMENASMFAGSPFGSYYGDFDNYLTQSECDIAANNLRVHMVPELQNWGEDDFWLPFNNANALADFFRDAENQMNMSDSGFENVDSQTMDDLIDQEPFPDLTLDDLADDSDEINDQVFSDNNPSNPNVSLEDNSLNTLPDQIEDDVFESSPPLDNVDSYFESPEDPVNGDDPILQPEASGRDDWFDSLFDEELGNTTDPPMRTSTPVDTNETAEQNDESPISDFFAYGDSIDRELDEYLGFK